MGCSSSLPSVVIPDPGPTEQCVFTVKSAGMFKGDDCFAYKGDSTDKDSKWMILDKSKPTGDPRVNVAAGQRLLELENFNRAEGSKKGEILLSAVFDSKPAFTVMSKSEFSQTQLRPAWAMQFSKAVPVQISAQIKFRGVSPWAPDSPVDLRTGPDPAVQRLLRRHDAVGCDGQGGPAARLAAGASHADLRSGRQDAGLRLHRQGL